MKKLMIFIGFSIFVSLMIAAVLHLENISTQPSLFYAENEIDYSLQNDELQITFDNGKNWTRVPIEKETLFNGEYNGSEQELIEGSYILTENRAAFLYSEYVNEMYDYDGIHLKSVSYIL